MLTVIVGSQNPVKVSAVKNALQSVYPDADIECQGVDAPSGVPDQPMTAAETRAGALNRMHFCRNHHHADFYAAIEGGLEVLEDGPVTCAYVAIADNQRTSVGRSAALPLPQAVYDGLVAGDELSDVIDAQFGTQNIKHKEGAMGLLTNGLATRESTYRQALILALAPFMHPLSFSA
uniref:inosine/xanthosine triphosphatase n=1 Tax=Thaumasiovibrio subtropicus TaxID=1891207 RepID=UPI00192CECCA|nr:inosine/xanthosine triphosphatase [Thaumasiovibrio subtropicus]